MAMYTKVLMTTIRGLALALLSTRMDLSIVESGWMTKSMARGVSKTKMAFSGKDNGSMESSSRMSRRASCDLN
jgi:hypothetical protein